MAEGQEDIDAALAAESSAQTSTAITVVFDTSGSMGDRNKIQQAKRAFTWWLNGLPDDYRFCLIQCDGRSKVVVPLGAAKDEVTRKVATFRPGSGTPIVNSLILAGREIAKRRAVHSPYERHVVVLFTDGRESVHRGGIRKVREEVTALRDLKVEVVGIGFHGEGDYLRDVSTSYYQANDEEQLKEGLASVDAEVDLTAEIQVTPGDVQTMNELASDLEFGTDPGIPVNVDERELESDGHAESVNITVNGRSASGGALFFSAFVCMAIFFVVFAGIVVAFVKFLGSSRR